MPIKDQNLHIRLTPAEDERLRALAASRSMSASELVCALVDKEAPSRLEALKRAFSSVEYFCNMLQVRDSAGATVPFVLNTHQQQYLRVQTHRDIYVKERQTGLSSVMLAEAMFTFLTVPGARVEIVTDSDVSCNRARKSLTEHARRLEARHIDLALKKCTPGYFETATGILNVSYAPGSTKALKNYRGVTITHLYCEEMSYWDHAKDVWNVLRGCVPPSPIGRVAVSSTRTSEGGTHFDAMLLDAMLCNGPFTPHIVGKDLTLAKTGA